MCDLCSGGVGEETAEVVDTCRDGLSLPEAKKWSEVENPYRWFFFCGAEDEFGENSWWGVTEGLSCRGRGDGKSKMVSLFVLEEGGDEVGEEDTKDGKGVVEEIQGLVPKGRIDNANMGNWL